MIVAEACFPTMVEAPVRFLRGRVELYNGSTLLQTFKDIDRVREITIERVAEEGKFFGFGICQKLNVKLIDKSRELNITTANALDVAFGTDCEFIYACPLFNVSQVHRDETTNELSITAYDGLYEATKRTVNELVLPQTYSIKVFVASCASLLGLPFAIDDSLTVFNTEYSLGANFEGTESIREALNAVAEATQTIYYLDANWNLVFKRLDRDGEPVYTIGKQMYFDLECGDNRRLVSICSATELGDNVSASLAVSGTTQYVRDNAFWELREDIGTLVQNALNAIGGLTINQFNCNWRGNFLLEIGDKIALETKNGGRAISYLLDDIITFDGTYRQHTQWNYFDTENESESNPVSIGDALKQTYAKVDKANKQITMLVSNVDNNASNIASLMLNTESINATVSRLEDTTTQSIQSLNGDISLLSSKVDATITADDVSIAIQKELANGTDKVITSTGFVFNEDGLNISKTGSEMNTQITEDGMTVSRDNTVVLTANNVGVEATNLHANTYLIIGTHSRFEDYGNRTGCFWIG